MTVDPTPEKLARLRWLVRLRWLALLGVLVAAAAAAVGVVPGVNVGIVGLAVGLGLGFNVYLGWRARRLGDTDDKHVWQALLDTGALTLVVWAAGGAECPFIGFYVFPVLLASLLAGRDALWQTGAASALGVLFQVAATEVSALRVGVWDPAPPWDTLLFLTAVLMTIAMVAYFATVFTDVLREQVEARREADAMLRFAFQGLDAGVEVLAGPRIVWQNPQATELLGRREGRVWTCPGTCSRQSVCSDGRCEFALQSQVYERHTFALPERDRSMVLYLDRTTEVLGRRKLMLTERLASLGRTVQGVAHELNTPLSTIQTLGRDVLDALQSGDLPSALREDVEESARMVVEEVQRCRRITHALLGRVEQLDPEAHGEAALSVSVDRALAVVLTGDRERASCELGEAGRARVPMDPVVQILVNLLQNATDASDGPIEVGGALGDGRVRVWVRDHGPGLSDEARAHLFEPFHTTKPPGLGTGLGLYTSYALARELGGELTVANHPDGGVEAVLSIPSS